MGQGGREAEGPYQGDGAAMLPEARLRRAAIACDLDIDIRSEEICSVQMTWKLFILRTPRCLHCGRERPQPLTSSLETRANKQTNKQRKHNNNGTMGAFWGHKGLSRCLARLCCVRSRHGPRSSTARQQEAEPQAREAQWT